MELMVEVHLVVMGVAVQVMVVVMVARVVVAGKVVRVRQVAGVAGHGQRVLLLLLLLEAQVVG